MSVTRQQVYAARVFMKLGFSMSDAATSLGIVPSGRLDKALWEYLSVKDSDLVEATQLQIERKRRHRPDF